MKPRTTAIAVIFILVLVIGFIAWGVQAKVDPNTGQPIYIADVIVAVEGRYSDFNPVHHILTNWQMSASAQNWRQASNLDLTAMQTQRSLSWFGQYAIWWATYKVQLKIMLMQNGQVANDADGKPLVTDVSFSLDFSPGQYEQTFSHGFRLQGVKEGTYTVRIQVMSSQYIDIHNSIDPTDDLQSVEFTQSFARS